MRQTGFTRHITIAVALGILGTTALWSEAGAISRIRSTSMTCSAVQQAVKRSGALLVLWRSKTTGNPRYDRFVRNKGYCSINEVTDYAYVPTSDRKSCRLRKCIPRSFLYDDDDFFLLRRR